MDKLEGLPDAQVNAIRKLVARYNTAVENCRIIRGDEDSGPHGTPVGWVEFHVGWEWDPRHGRLMVVLGVSPDGDVGM